MTLQVEQTTINAKPLTVIKIIHGIAEEIHGITEGIHGITEGIHGIAEGIHGIAKGIHGIAVCMLMFKVERTVRKGLIFEVFTGSVASTIL